MTDYDEAEIFAEAQEVEYHTGLNEREAIIAVAAQKGLDDGEIGTIVGRSANRVNQIRERLREKRLRLKDETERTIDALDGV